MELILAESDGRELKALDVDIDIDLGSSNDFEIAFSASDYDEDVDYDRLIVDAGSEYGGIVGEKESDSDNGIIYVRGHTWRGLLDKKIISPASGADYYTVTGELNACIRTLLNAFMKDSLFAASGDNTGITVSGYQFNRYCTLLEGIEKMLSANGYRLNIEYVQTESGGYVELAAVEIEDHDAEFSEDSGITFTTSESRRGINHLICLGSGELAARTVVHIYADQYGNIVNSQVMKGRKEIAEVFDYPSAEDATDLRTAGLERMEDVKSSKTFSAAANEALEEDIPIGDTATGTDFITGITVTKPVVKKIVKIEAERITFEYKLEGEE